MRKLVYMVAASSLLLSFGCSKSSKNTFQLQSDQGSPLAEVGNVTLSVEGVTERLNKEPSFIRKQYASDAAKKEEYLDHQVSRELMVQEAIRRGFLNSPEVQDSVKRALVQKLSKEALKDQSKPEDIKDEQVQAYYDANQKEFHVPEKLRANYIYIPFGDNKAKSLAKANEAAKKASDKTKKHDSEYFQTLIAQYGTADSKAPAGQKMGDTGYMTAEELTQQLGAKAEKTLAALPATGDVNGPVEEANGYYILRNAGKRDAVNKDLATAKPMIQRKLYYQSRRDSFTKFVDGLKTSIGVKIHKERLTDVKPNLADSPNDHPMF